MSIKEMRTPTYVVNMIKTILEFKGMIVDEDYISACENRRKSVERVMDILLTVPKKPDDLYLLNEN